MAHKEVPLSRDDSISTLVARCFQSFGKLDAHISSGFQSLSKQMDEDEFLDELGRLRVWAANIGAHRTGRISMDFRLRDAPHIRTRIQGLLYDLEENIRRTSDIISGASLPWDRLELDSDSDAESSESELGDETFEGTEQEQLKNSIHETITLLSRLSMVVRNPAMHDRRINSSQAVAIAYSTFDVKHVSEKFPDAPSHLANNLGKAISRRRQYLDYLKGRHEKLAQGLEAMQQREGLDGKSEAPSESIAATSLPEAIKLMSQEGPEREPYSDSEASHTSFARSNSDDGERQKIPPFPREGAGGTPFECPICFMMITAPSQESWKRHVFRDIHPYVCTFPDCTTPQRLFSRRREWFLHELEMHRCHWQCAHGCWGDFKTASQFEDHARASHPEYASPEDLAKLSIASSRSMSQWSLVNCSMCGEKDISIQKLESHLGRHQEDLALFAMTSAGYELEGDSTEETNSSEANASIKSEDLVSSSVVFPEGDRQETIVDIQAKKAGLRAIRDEEDGVDRCPLCGWRLEDQGCAQCGLQFDDNGTLTRENSFGGFNDMDETSEHDVSGEKEEKERSLPKPLQGAPIPQVNIWKQRAESKAIKSQLSNTAPTIKPVASTAKSPAQTSPNKTGNAKVNAARMGKDFSASGGYQNLRDGGHEDEGDEGEQSRPDVQPAPSTAGLGLMHLDTVNGERNMHRAGNSRHSPRIRYADESSSTESLPPTPVNGATFVHPSPKNRKTGSFGQTVFNIGGSRKEKEKQKGKPKTTTTEATTSPPPSSSSVRSYSPAPPSPTYKQNPNPTYQYSHRRSHSATMPSKPWMAYATTARAVWQPNSRRREEIHLLSPQANLPLVTPLTQADAPRRPPGPPRPPEPPAHIDDPPSPKEPSRRERQADESWAQYHRDLEERREEGRKMNEQSQPDDEDWEAQLEEGRRRLAELRRTEEAARKTHAANRERRPAFSSSYQPHRRNPTGVGENNQRYRHRSLSDSSSSYKTLGSTTSADTTTDDGGSEVAEHDIRAFEREQIARERQRAHAMLTSQIADAMLASQIADAQADVQRAEARIAARAYNRGKANYGAFTYDGVNSYYNPRLGRRSMRPSVPYHQYPAYRWEEQREPDDGQEEDQA